MAQQNRLVPPANEEDLRLLERARGRLGTDFPDGINEAQLRDVAAAEGIDLATAMLYEHLRSRPDVDAFMSRIENRPIDSDGEDPPRVVVMPGAFHVEYPHTGAGGARVFELAQKLGWQAERVMVPSLAPMAANAAALVDLLARDPGRPTILVSLSKGGADIRAALERPDAEDALRDVRAWVSVSGIVTGTPLVGWLTARPLRCCGARLLLRIRRQRFAVVEELRRGCGSPMDRAMTIPPWMRVIHVNGFPLVRNLSDSWARRGHARLAALGPNDGGGILLADLARLRGELYPVWGADHYLQPSWDIRPLLLRILQEAASQKSRAPEPALL